MNTYGVDFDEADKHMPAHPERTVVGGTNPFTVYFREFSTRAAMVRWFSRQSWSEKQEWSPWLKSKYRQHLPSNKPRRPRRASEAECEQQSLFA